MGHFKFVTINCIILTFVFYSCTTANEKKSESNATNTEVPKVVLNKDGLPKAEKGITVVSPTGWTKEQMEFQQRYCESMFGELEGYDPVNFCLCFLDKVQYYYEPIYVREAYEDQKKWNSYCLNEAIL